MTPRLDLSREQILAHRRAVGALVARLPPGSDSLRRAAWAGLQDSMPRAALLSIHARVEGTGPSTWEDPSLVQVWGPRFGAFVVAADDRASFTLGRLPQDARGLRRANETADRLDAFLAGRRMPYGEAGRGLGMAPNSLRYAAPTGRVLIRWDGARQPVVWTVPAPVDDPRTARAELARRYLHVFGPAAPERFATWAGIPAGSGRAALDLLGEELLPVGTPIGDAWILRTDEASFRSEPVDPPSTVRLLPSGDTYSLLWGADRELLVPDPRHRAQLWTSRVWPGAILAGGEVVGTWRRADTVVALQPWRTLAAAERSALEAEATSLPLPGAADALRVRWER